MGKTDNIKRAKRLKEAKRQRDQDALIASGQGPAAKELKKRIELEGVEVITNQEPLKYSELLESFAIFMVEEIDTIDMIRLKLMFAIHAWNSAVIRETNEERYLELKNEYADLFADTPESEEIFDNLVERKQKLFAEYTNIIADFEVEKILSKGIKLTVTSVPYDAI